MAQLTWQNIQTDFGGGGNRSINIGDTINPLSAALARYGEKRQNEVSAAEIQKGLQISDPDLFNQALKAGVFQITPENQEFFRTRASDLLAEQLAHLSQDKVRSELAAQPGIQEGQRLANVNAGLVIEQNQQTLRENLDAWNQKLDQREVLPQAMGRIAQIQDLATKGNVEGALGLLRDPANIEFLLKGGFTQEKIDALGQGLYTAASAARTEVSAQKDFDFKEGSRALTEREATKKAERAAVAGDRGEVAATFTEEQAQRARDAQKLTDQEADLVKTEFPKVLSQMGTVDEMYEYVKNHPEWSPSVKGAMLTAIETAAPTVATISKEDFRAQQLAAGGAGATIDPRTQAVPTAAGSVLGLIDQTEGGGNYSTLYNNSQKPGGAFQGYDVSTKTIGELDTFANVYGGYVAANNNGVKATPMGRYQIVNSTLQGAAQRLGLSPDTVFDAATQDKIFQFLINQRLGTPGSLQDKMYGMRQEWAGLKNVDDATLGKAIQDFQSGSMGGLEAALQGETTTQIPIDETSGEAAQKALTEFIAKPLEIALTPQENEIVYDQADALASQAAMVTNALTVDDMFGGQGAALLEEMMSKETKTKLVGEVAKEVSELFGDMPVDQLTDDINYFAEKYNVPAGIAGAFLKAAPVETLWVNPLSDDRVVDRTKMDKLFTQFYNPDGTDPAQQIRGALEKMQTIQDKNAGADNIKVKQERVADAMADYINTANRKQSNPKIDKKALKKLQIAEQDLQNELKRINAAASSTANIRAAGAL